MAKLNAKAFLILLKSPFRRKKAKDQLQEIAAAPKLVIPIDYPPPSLPHNLITLPALLFYLVDNYLDRIDAVFLALTCRALYNAIREKPFSLKLERGTKLTVLPHFRPRYNSIQQHPHPYLCTECAQYHSLAQTAIWPYWNTEDAFASFEEFASQPRVCVRQRVHTGQWKISCFIDSDKNYILCEKCNGLSSREWKCCSWRCKECRNCWGRWRWSALCENCTKARGGEEIPMVYKGVVCPLSRTQPDNSLRSQPEKVCYMCLGTRKWAPYSVETCRCFF